MKNSVVHLYIYGMLKREIGGGNIIHISQIHPVIKWIVRIPKKYQREIINEMVNNGFLKKQGRDNYELLTIPIRINLSDCRGNPLW